MPRPRKVGHALKRQAMDFYERLMFLIHPSRAGDDWRELWAANRDELMNTGQPRPGIRPWPFWLVDAGGGDLVDHNQGTYSPGYVGHMADSTDEARLWQRRCRWLAANGQLREGEASAIAAEWLRRRGDILRYADWLKLRGELPADYQPDPLWSEPFSVEQP